MKEGSTQMYESAYSYSKSILVLLLSVADQFHFPS